LRLFSFKPQLEAFFHPPPFHSSLHPFQIITLVRPRTSLFLSFNFYHQFGIIQKEKNEFPNKGDNPITTKTANLRLDDYVRGIGRLKPDEQLTLIQIISARLKKTRKRKRAQHSVMELEGLGAHIWKSIDPQQYVSKERKSWE
jgi:hypothetical protein